MSAQIQQWKLKALVFIGLISSADSLEELDVRDKIPFGNVKPLNSIAFFIVSMNDHINFCPVSIGNGDLRPPRAKCLI